MGVLTGKPGKRAKTSGKAAGKWGESNEVPRLTRPQSSLLFRVTGSAKAEGKASPSHHPLRFALFPPITLRALRFPTKETTGDESGSSRQSRSLTWLRRDCRGSLPISPAAVRLVLARLSRPPKPPATQAIERVEIMAK